jgi:NAD(P)-dependent dehydrogenase (short-subunit alcohol dehydrogenase family)
MNTIVIAGGNSGIGLQAARKFLAAGHRVIILGRDKQKGAEAIASFGEAQDRANFLSVDLSTNGGVRDAAQRVNEITDHIDGLLHSTGVFEVKDIRTVDGLTLFFAVSYLSRYHLTQLLLPALLRAEHPRVVMMTAKLNPVPKVDLRLFPQFERFNFITMGQQINAANLYYADHLSKTNSKIFAGVVFAGFARTDIFRRAPWYMRAMVTVSGPFFSNSIEESAHNAVEAILKGEGSSAFYWDKPGDFERKDAVQLDEKIRNGIIDASRKVTGA